MATLADQRRATRDSITASRQATGEAERKATGKRLEAERRGTAVVEDLNRLVQQPAPRRTLRPVAPLGALPQTTGRGNYTPPPTPGPGGGIASPLEEKTKEVGGQQVADGREYHATGQVFETTDGIFGFIVRPLKKTVMVDANGIEHPFGYAMPDPGE